MVDQDPLHGDGRGAEEAAAVGERRGAQAEERLVDQRRGVERVPSALARQPGGGQPLQLLVDRREEAAGRLGGPGPAGPAHGFGAPGASFARSAFHAATSAVVPTPAPAAIRRSSAWASRGRSTSGIAAADRAIPS